MPIAVYKKLRAPLTRWLYLYDFLTNVNERIFFAVQRKKWKIKKNTQSRVLQNLTNTNNM